eukprot:scaffold56255_cov31-Tisochrysis_lutea.AAC.1
MMPKLLEAIGETLRPPHQTPSLVLYSFFTLIDDLLVRPLRQRLNGRSSIRDFCSVRVQISRPGGVYGRVPSFGTSAATPSSVRAMALEQGSDDLPSRTAIKEAYNKPLATLDEFMAQYSLYCLENDVEPLLLDEVSQMIDLTRAEIARSDSKQIISHVLVVLLGDERNQKPSYRTSRPPIHVKAGAVIKACFPRLDDVVCDKGRCVRPEPMCSVSALGRLMSEANARHALVK